MESVLLPRAVRPSHYRLSIDTDLALCAFSGTVSIDLVVDAATSCVELHSVELELSEPAVLQGGADVGVVSVAASAERQTTVLTLASPLVAGRAAVLSCRFSGKLNDRLLGYYRSRYAIGDEQRYMGVTQFEPCDARRAFPCFDEPAMKASFDIELTVDKGKVALSNMPVVSRTELPDGRERLAFARTPVMSTYIVAFIVGDFEFIEATSADDVLVRIYALPGVQERGRFALDVATRSVTFYKDVFGIAYPLPKMDMIAIPDFAAGAMENFGCITYREARLLVDAQFTAAATKQATARTTCHEISHQWFGNLVTMQWWTDLWLNEGFARWAEHLAVDHVFPEWDIWTQFVAAVQSVALDLDAMSNTHPIEVPVGRPEEVNEIFDSISYAKGASVILMLSNFMGVERFCAGIRKYLEKHAYGNAASEDLWSSLEEQAPETPVRSMMQGWTRQPGYPVIVVQRGDAAPGSTVLHVSQRRFSSSGAESDATWIVPLRIRLSSGAVQHVVLTERSATFTLDGASEWVLVNADNSGFYRVHYTADMHAALVDAANKGALNAKERVGLLSDASAFALAGMQSSVSVLQMVAAFGRETDFSVLSTISAALGSLRHVFDEEDFVPALRELTARVFAPTYERVGWEARASDAHLDSLTRSLAVTNMCRARHADAVAEAKRRVRAYLDGGEAAALPADVRTVAMQTCVRHDDGTTFYDALLAAYDRTQVQEEKNRMLSALGYHPSAERAEQTLGMTFSPKVRSQDAALPISYVASSPEGRRMAWAFLKERFDFINETFGDGQFLIGSLIKAATSGFTSSDAADEVERFFQVKPAKGAERTVRQVVESIRATAALRTRDAASVRAFLAQ